jgi:hypothetical protein
VERLTALLDLFPARELEVRRLYARDENFRGACDDYELAMKALRHWECGKNNTARALEYRQLAGEIASEIMARLDAASVRKLTEREQGKLT